MHESPGATEQHDPGDPANDAPYAEPEHERARGGDAERDVGRFAQRTEEATAANLTAQYRDTHHSSTPLCGIDVEVGAVPAMRRGPQTVERRDARVRGDPPRAAGHPRERSERARVRGRAGEAGSGPRGGGEKAAGLLAARALAERAVAR